MRYSGHKVGCTVRNVRVNWSVINVIVELLLKYTILL